MGLAPYGKPVYLDLIKKELVRTSGEGSFLLNEKYFDYISGLRMVSTKFEKLFGRKALSPDVAPDQFYMDVAASIQEYFNETLVSIAAYAKKITGMNKLCIAGGVGLNCVANSYIMEEGLFDDIWVQPAAGDAGGALGAALYVHYCYLGNKRNADEKNDLQKGSCLGPSYSDVAIEEVLKGYGAVYKKVTDSELIRTVADEIKSLRVIGWFQGRMEFGPRALGNRSILGDARSEDMQSTMNLKIKFRESFRPFAPSVLEEKSRDYFECKKASPYMLFTARVRKDRLLNADTSGKKGLELLKVKRSVIPAVTHLDNTARLQTVSKDTNNLFYSLLKEFERISGCPLMINTSFNVRGEPIVACPSDAYRCFMGTNIDILAIGHYLLYKKDQPLNKEYRKWKKTLLKD